MEGQGDIEQEDKEGISERFKMMPSVNFAIDGKELPVNGIRQILHYAGIGQEFLLLITLVELL